MPTYEYVCTSCENHWEEIQKISENPIEVCPKCAQATAKRQISGGNFILKGGGWYADLYSSPKPKEGKSKEVTTTEGSPSGSARTGAESKPETSSSAGSTASSGNTSGGGGTSTPPSSSGGSSSSS